MHPDRGEVAVQNLAAPDDPPRRWTFDAVYDDSSTQQQVYDETCRPVVDSVLEGYNATIFAYGQTGAGKTHTMEGLRDPPEMKGVIPNTFDHIFQAITDDKSGKEYLVRASFLEIYKEEVRDLLSKTPKQKLDLKQHPKKGVYVKGLTTHAVKSIEEIDDLLTKGKKHRQVAFTHMNDGSSRSHSIFQITVETSEPGPNPGKNLIKAGMLSLVDLAGSERQAKTQATGEQLEEAKKINLSLSTLGLVIKALATGDKSVYVPYRSSQLTRLLENSLGGNSKTVMLAAVGPAGWNFDETVGTLRYADRAKSIQNKVQLDLDPKDAMLLKFQEEIEKLKAMLSAEGKDPNAALADGSGGAASGGGAHAGMSMEAMKQLQASGSLSDKEREELQKEMDDREAKLAESEKQRVEMESQLKELQDRVLQSGAELASKEDRNKAALRKAAAKIKEEKRKSEEEKRKSEEAALQLQLQKKEWQKDSDDKSKLIEMLDNKVKDTEAHLADTAQEFNREMGEKLDIIRELTQQLKLKMLIIDHFVPPDEAVKIERRAEWNEGEDEWFIPKLDYSGNAVRMGRPESALGLSRPVTAYAAANGRTGDQALAARFRTENVLNLDLDMPMRTTQDWDPNEIAMASAERAELARAGAGAATADAMGALYYSYDEPSRQEMKSRGGSRGVSRGGSRESQGVKGGVRAVRRPGSAAHGDRVKSRGGQEGASYPTAVGLVSSGKHFA